MAYNDTYKNVEGPIDSSVKEGFGVVLRNIIAAGPAADDSDFQGPEYTLELSFRHSHNVQANATVYYNAGATTYPWYFKITPESPASGQCRIQVLLDTDTCAATTVITYDITRDDAWHIATVTYNVAGNATLYLDGAQVAQVSAPCNNLNITPAAGVELPKIVGGSFDIGEVSFYNRELTNTEVFSHHSTWATDKAAREALLTAPKTDPSLIMWFDASQLTGFADAQELAVFNVPAYTGMMLDYSGRKHHLQKDGLNNAPHYKTNIQNSLPAIRFVGSNLEYLLGLFDDLQMIGPSYTIHTVIKPTTGLTGNGYLLYDQGAAFILFMDLSNTWGFYDGTNLISSATTNGVWKVYTWHIDNSTLTTTLYENGVSVASGTYVGGSVVGSSPIDWGTSGAQNWLTADWGETTVFTKAQSPAELAAEVARLTAKWGV